MTFQTPYCSRRTHHTPARLTAAPDIRTASATPFRRATCALYSCSTVTSFSNSTTLARHHGCNACIPTRDPMPGLAADRLHETTPAHLAPNPAEPHPHFPPQALCCWKQFASDEPSAWRSVPLIQTSRDPHTSTHKQRELRRVCRIQLLIRELGATKRKPRWLRHTR